MATGRQLNDSVRVELRRIVQERFTTFAEASRLIGKTQTWLGRRLNVDADGEPTPSYGSATSS